MFILAAPNFPRRGRYEGARLLDIAPTLLELAGHPIPATMQGQSLIS
jgi:bisphosphoglycerate-independent phosphoglycerate mutase (AlkP superfamily)